MIAAAIAGNISHFFVISLYLKQIHKDIDKQFEKP